MRFVAIAGVVLLCAQVVVGQTGTPPAAQNWINVRDYGAIGDDKHDDGPAVLAAVTVAAHDLAKRTVYFPPTTSYYYIGTSLALPPGGNWVKVYLDGGLDLNGTLTVPSAYTIIGNAGGPLPQFVTNSGVYIVGRNPNVKAVIELQGSGIRLENLFIVSVKGDADGIYFDNSICCVTLSNVSVQVDAANLTGSAVRTNGGFRFLFEGGFYYSSAQGSAPTFSFGIDETRCDATGIVTMRDVAIAAHGISMIFPCGVAGPFTFENILYESFKDSFLTMSGVPSTSILGTYIKNVQMSDPTVPQPWPSLITNHGTLTAGVQVINSWGPWNEPIPPIVTGDPINGLEVWTPFDPPAGQRSGYVLHQPMQIISTIPTSSNAVIPIGPPVPPSKQKPPLPEPPVLPRKLMQP